MAAIRRSGEATRLPPVVPLRYRIDPTAKKLDDLDKLESELERDKSKYEQETYFELLDIIHRQRDTLSTKRNKHSPEVPEYVSPWLSDIVPRARGKPIALSKVVGWLLFLFVVVKVCVK